MDFYKIPSIFQTQMRFFVGSAVLLSFRRQYRMRDYWRSIPPPVQNDPFEGSAFQASLDLSKIRNLQMDHFALIRYVENIPGATPFGNDPFEGSAFQASLDLPKIRNLQMDHF